MSAPPPSYNDVVHGQSTQSQQNQWNISYVDFTPGVVDPGGFMSSPKYERFEAVIAKANQWLMRNPEAKVKTCESIEVKNKSYSGVSTEKSTFTEQGKAPTFYVRCLRLWLIPNDSPEPQQIGYVNMVPECIESGGIFSDPKFETFGVALGKLNQHLRNRPIPGRILNVETQDMKFKSYSGCDPDKSSWKEYGEAPTYFLIVIRVFFETGQPQHEEIGCADFTPNRTRSDGFVSTGDFEPFHVVVSKAYHWIQQNPGLHVVNVQSLDYKLKSTYEGNLDTQRSLYRERGKGYTYYVRMLRVCYTTRYDGGPLPAPLTQLNYKTFSPPMVGSGGAFSIPTFELQSQNMRRAMAWFKQTGAKVLCAETVTVRFSGHQHLNPEVTYTYNTGRIEHHLYIFRIYIDGVYREPPPQSLPPRPQMVQDDDCCNIL